MKTQWPVLKRDNTRLDAGPDQWFTLELKNGTAYITHHGKGPAYKIGQYPHICSMDVFCYGVFVGWIKAGDILHVTRIRRRGRKLIVHRKYVV